jgi:1-acyl-sn-glycerol-3-phosphate acyltransferase
MSARRDVASHNQYSRPATNRLGSQISSIGSVEQSLAFPFSLDYVRLASNHQRVRKGRSRLKWSEQIAASDDTHATDPRPPAYFMPFHRRARECDPGQMYEVLRLLTRPWVLTVLRAGVVGVDHVPAHGPVIITSNHGSYLDNFILGAFVRRRLHFMAKSQMFQFPSQWVYSHAGAFPVRRGLQDNEAMATGMAILARGGALAIYAAGRRSAHPTDVMPKPGVGHLALESGAPVIPIAIHGSSRIRYWKSGEIPKVTLVRGRPVQWDNSNKPDHEKEMAVASAIYREIERLYDIVGQNA